MQTSKRRVIDSDDISIPSGPVRAGRPGPHDAGDCERPGTTRWKLLTRAGGMVSIAVAEEAGEAVVRVRDTGAGDPRNS